MKPPDATEAIGPELTMQFDPIGDPDADVEAVAFAESILTAIRALRRTTSLLAEGTPVPVRYQIVDLTHSSPATATFRARVPKPSLPLLERAQELFVEAIGDITHGVLPEFLDYPSLRTYQQLGNLARKGRFINRIRLNGTGAEVTPRLKDRLDRELAKDVIVHGSIRGRLKVYSTYGSRNLIRVVPRTTPPVTCEFLNSLKPEVARLIEHEVIVTGPMRYRPNAYHPYYMKIRRIEPADRSQILLSEVRDPPSEPAEGTPSEDIIREIRRAW